MLKGGVLCSTSWGGGWISASSFRFFFKRDLSILALISLFSPFRKHGLLNINWYFLLWSKTTLLTLLLKFFFWKLGGASVDPSVCLTHSHQCEVGFVWEPPYFLQLQDAPSISCPVQACFVGSSWNFSPYSGLSLQTIDTWRARRLLHNR